MKKIILILIMLFLVVVTKAQIYQPISFPEKIDKKYEFNSLRELEKYQNKVRKSIPKKYLENFTYAMVYGKTEMFTSGGVYLSWEAMESYVNKILDSIIPANLVSKKIKAYIGRSSSINAFCLYDGTMIVNVGLLAEVKSEAALAAIMGHELGHFIKNHNLTGFKNSIKAKKGNKSGFELDLKNKKFSQDNENEADNLGFDIAKSANYDLNEALTNFELFIREKEYYEKRNRSMLANTDSVTITTTAGKYKANTLEKLLSSHPDMKDRKDKLLAYMKSNPQTKKKIFKINEEQFLALQKQARLECITLVFNQHDYEECLERAFRYYLSKPDELSYAYYTAESIRRLCLFDYRLKKKGFLTEKLTNSGFKEGEGILHDLKFIIPNSDSYNSIKAKDLLVKANYPFETYKEAFYYFSKKLIEKDNPEGYLSQALFENNKTKIKENVANYVRHPKAKHKDFANCYMNGNLGERVVSNKKEIVMIPRVNFYSHTAFNSAYPFGLGSTNYFYKKSETLGSDMANSFADKFNGNAEEVKAISLPKAQVENFNTKYKYETIIKATFLASREENEGYEVVHYYKELEDEDYVGKVDIFRLEPNTWEFFINNQINTISYASYTRHHSRVQTRMNTILYIFALPTAGITGIVAIGNATNFKKLSLYSFNPKLGALYYDYHLKGRKIRSKSALKMYNKMRTNREKYIRDYNTKY